MEKTGFIDKILAQSERIWKSHQSHITRLSNRMASPLSVPEKNILRQRKENLIMAKEVYMGMQRLALGLAEPQQEKAGMIFSCRS